ncbi:MAG: diguanylate cyclase response regulator [Acidobacteria bacterium]|nr:MAG: diguanylate cyclase response regulator [Acidobacteriota bacterium]
MKILIAEDDLLSLRILESFLEKWEFDVVATRDGRAALQALQAEDGPRLAILDWMMPEMDGVELCRVLRKVKGERYIYIILLTAKDQKESIVEGIEAGADDYLIKPFDSNELRARLRAGRRILALQETLISAREALRFQASHDPLTSLWNRTAALDALHSELVRAKRTKGSLAVVMADLDHFKKINDTHGHLAGDAALRETARRIRSCVRIYDTVGRYGGEEFLVIFPGCSTDEAINRVELATPHDSLGSPHVWPEEAAS